MEANKQGCLAGDRLRVEWNPSTERSECPAIIMTMVTALRAQGSTLYPDSRASVWSAVHLSEQTKSIFPTMETMVSLPQGTGDASHTPGSSWARGACCGSQHRAAQRLQGHF